MKNVVEKCSLGSNRSSRHIPWIHAHGDMIWHFLLCPSLLQGLFPWYSWFRLASKMFWSPFSMFFFAKNEKCSLGTIPLFMLTFGFKNESSSLELIPPSNAYFLLQSWLEPMSDFALGPSCLQRSVLLTCLFKISWIMFSWAIPYSRANFL